MMQARKLVIGIFASCLTRATLITTLITTLIKTLITTLIIALLATLIATLQCTNSTEVRINYLQDQLTDHLYAPRISFADYDALIRRRANHPTILKRYVYSRFRSDFDFIVYFMHVPEGVRSSIPPGSYSPIQNKVMNIGSMHPFNISSRIEPNNKLLGIISLRAILAYRSPLLHEVAHAFAAFADSTRRKKWADALEADTPGEDRDFDAYLGGGHWLYSGAKEVAPVTTMPYTRGELPLGQLGGFRESSVQSCAPASSTSPSPCRYLTDPTRFPPDKTYAIEGTVFFTGGPRAIYNDRELYLMGYIPFSEVLDEWTWIRISAITQAKNGLVIEIYAPDVPGQGKGVYKITKERFRELLTPPMEDGTSIPVAQQGRNPDHTNSQKHFKAMALIIQNPSYPLDRQTIAEMETQLRLMSMPMSDGTRNTNFWEATGGRGTIEFGNLEASLR